MHISVWSTDVCSSDLGISAPTMRRNITATGTIFRASTRRNANSASGRSGATRAAIRTAPIMAGADRATAAARSEEHTSELQSLMRISYAVFCLKQTKTIRYNTYTYDKQDKTQK